MFNDKEVKLSNFQNVVNSAGQKSPTNNKSATKWPPITHHSQHGILLQLTSLNLINNEHYRFIHNCLRQKKNTNNKTHILDTKVSDFEPVKLLNTLPAVQSHC